MPNTSMFGIIDYITIIFTIIFVTSYLLYALFWNYLRYMKDYFLLE